MRGVPNGQMALTVVENEPPELILLDVRMPEMDGYQVCRQLKEKEKYRDIPVLFLSALSEAADKVKGFEAGAVEYLSIPFMISFPNYDNLIPGKLMRAIVFLS